MGRTLAEKIWDAHVVRSAAGEPDLLYIDLHLLHEVTSPQAFDGLRAASRWAVARGRPVRLTSSARVAGSSATARRMATALSKTATGLGCPTQQYSHLTV